MGTSAYDPIFNPNPHKEDEEDSQSKPIEGDPAFKDDAGDGLIDKPSGE
jgi:hypothetical protein